MVSRPSLQYPEACLDLNLLTSNRRSTSASHLTPASPPHTFNASALNSHPLKHQRNMDNLLDNFTHFAELQRSISRFQDSFYSRRYSCAGMFAYCLFPTLALPWPTHPLNFLLLFLPHTTHACSVPLTLSLGKSSHSKLTWWQTHSLDNGQSLCQPNLISHQHHYQYFLPWSSFLIHLRHIAPPRAIYHMNS